MISEDRLVETNPFLFELDKLYNNEQTKQSLKENLKLSFNNNSLLDLYVIITGFSNIKNLNKTYSISRTSKASNSFFQKLHTIIEEKGNISLIKNISNEGNSFWSKGEFTINSLDNISLTIKEDSISINDQNRLNKLINILDSLESKLNIKITEKYLVGYLEERGITSFNDLINHQM